MFHDMFVCLDLDGHDMFTICSFNSPDLDGHRAPSINPERPRKQGTQK